MKTKGHKTQCPNKIRLLGLNFRHLPRIERYFAEFCRNRQPFCHFSSVGECILGIEMYQLEASPRRVAALQGFGPTRSVAQGGEAATESVGPSSARPGPNAVRPYIAHEILARKMRIYGIALQSECNNRSK